MREGRVFKRCRTCTKQVTPETRKRCDCGSDRLTYAFRVDVSPPGAPRRQALKQGFATKKDARAAMHELQRTHERGEAVEPSKQTLADYLAGWLDGVRAEYRPSTWDTARHHVESYIVPRIGSVRMQQLNRATVKALIADLRDSGGARVRCVECGAGVPRTGAGEHKRNGAPGRCDGRFAPVGSPLNEKTVHNVYRTLCRALNDAVDDKLLLVNPAAKAHKMPESPEQPHWTVEQLRVFYESVRGDRWFAMWRVFAASGMRRGEGAGLRWSDVDLDAARLTLVEARTKGKGGVTVGRLKGKRGRSVSLDLTTVAALRAWKAQQAAERLAWPGEWLAGDLVWTHEDGTPLHPDSMTKMFKVRVRQAGLPWIKLHGLRHSHASIALASGENIRLVQERLGHASIAITGDVYAHVTPEMDAQAAARVAAIVDGGQQ